MNRPRLSLFPLLLVLAAACSSSTEPDPIPGLYSLQSINGDPLPFVLVQLPDLGVVITAGHIQLNHDGTCSSSVTLQQSGIGGVTTATQEDTCTWTSFTPFASPVGVTTTIVFTSSLGETDVGTWADGTLTLIDPESETVSVYVKQ